MIRLGLIGYPVSHSLSVKIQNAAFQACGLEGDYSLFPILPEDRAGLKDLLDRIRGGEITGLNVTIPHKQNVIPLLDELTATAKAIGAVNIIYMKDGMLTGDNTDAVGFLKDLKRFMAGYLSSTVYRPSSIVLGAGGAARAVIYALVDDGWKVAIASRRMEQAQELAEQFNNCTILDFNLSTFQLSNVQLLINTTPVGMTPDIDSSPLPENISLPRHLSIYDLVYNPAETKLVCDARAQGLQATTGLGMLIEQAALAFEIWTGDKAPREAMLDAVDLTAH